MASELGFREAVGVELNPALAATAQANAGLWIAAGKARCPIRIEQGDAAGVSPRPAGPCLVFLFQPFRRAVMQRVADRIADTSAIRTSDVEILYYKAERPERLQVLRTDVVRGRPRSAPEDLAADPVADPKDETRAYRLATVSDYV